MTSRLAARAARKDINQPSIETALKAAGYCAWSLHRQGFGVPDLLVLSKTGVPVLMEIKMPGEQLTLQEIVFHKNYQGPLEIVRSEQEAVDRMAYWDGLRIEVGC